MFNNFVIIYTGLPRDVFESFNINCQLLAMFQEHNQFNIEDKNYESYNKYTVSIHFKLWDRIEDDNGLVEWSIDEEFKKKIYATVKKYKLKVREITFQNISYEKNSTNNVNKVVDYIYNNYVESQEVSREIMFNKVRNLFNIYLARISSNQNIFVGRDDIVIYLRTDTVFTNPNWRCLLGEAFVSGRHKIPLSDRDVIFTGVQSQGYQIYPQTEFISTDLVFMLCPELFNILFKNSPANQVDVLTHYIDIQYQKYKNDLFYFDNPDANKTPGQFFWEYYMDGVFNMHSVQHQILSCGPNKDILRDYHIKSWPRVKWTKSQEYKNLSSILYRDFIKDPGVISLINRINI